MGSHYLNIEIKQYLRFTPKDKYEIMLIFDGSDLICNRTLKELGLQKRTYYKGYAHNY
jgi:hypothetical protein